MKKDLWVKLAGLAIMLTLISSSLVSGTYAKYVKQVTGADTVRVAKFAFDLKSGADTADETQEELEEANFDVFSTTDAGLYNNGLNGTFVAPGTSGDFELQIDNLSEVKVSVAFSLVESYTNLPDGVTKIPIYYTIDGDSDEQRYSNSLVGAYDTTPDPDMEYKSLADLAEEIKVQSLAASDGTNPVSSTSVTLNWSWRFEEQPGVTGQSNDDDTKLGIAAAAAADPGDAPSVGLKVTATVTQVD